MNNRRLISVLGWEDRFLQGLKQDVEQFSINVVDLLIYEEYLPATSQHLNAANALSREAECTFREHHVHYKNPVTTWKYLQAWITREIKSDEEVWLDLTTMPRETIWSLLSFLVSTGCVVHYVYWPPASYTGEWLCKEPDRPRLLFKHSGVAALEKDTALIILTGYDEERTAQLVSHYEPKLTLLGIQTGEQFNNENRNSLLIHEVQCKGATDLQSFYVNAYEAQHGLLKLREVVTSLLDKYNVIVSSLGPKLSAIAVYKLYQEIPDIALTYVPTHQYNLNYSQGIKEGVTGTF